MRDAGHVFKQNRGDITKQYYAQMNALGLEGQLAVALFRAQKRSTAAKHYRGHQYKQAAYEVKNWSLSEICRIMKIIKTVADDWREWPFNWGWQQDPATPGFEWVLYVELPTGQCSFHSATRLDGPDYLGKWSGLHNSAEVILNFCDEVAARGEQQACQD